MDEKNYDLLKQVLQRLEAAGVLDGLIVVGSWSLLFYEDALASVGFKASIRTRDLDILVPLPPHFSAKADMQALIDDLGFVLVHRGRDGYITFQHPELIVEFLAPLRGRGSDSLIDVPALGVNAQGLRFLDMLCTDAIKARACGVTANVAHPVRFALHKLLIASRRRDAAKGEKDRSQAVAVLKSLLLTDMEELLKSTYLGMPKKWRHSVSEALLALGEEDILRRLQS